MIGKLDYKWKALNESKKLSSESTVDSSERIEDSEKRIESLEIEDSSISSFVENMDDCINDFIASISAYESDEELYECCEIEPEEPYGNEEYVYTTKAKAKVACKEAIKFVWNDTMDSYEVEKDNIISYTKDYFEGLEEEFKDFLCEFLDSYDEYIELECEGDSKEYVACKNLNFLILISKRKVKSTAF